MLWQDYGMVCNNAVVEHLDKYSNVFESSVTYNNYSLESIGFPFGVHGLNLKECVDFTIEQRISMNIENVSPICLNAISDWIDLADRISPMTEDEVLRQKNDATLTVLNNCDMESWPVHEILRLRSGFMP